MEFLVRAFERIGAMSTDNRRTRRGQFALAAVALLACWVFLVQLAEDHRFITQLAESLLRFIPCTVVLGIVTFLCWRHEASRAARVTILVFSVAVSFGLFLDVSKEIPSLEHVAVIGRQSNVRPILGDVLGAVWFGSLLLPFISC